MQKHRSGSVLDFLTHPNRPSILLGDVPCGNTGIDVIRFEFPSSLDVIFSTTDNDLLHPKSV